MLSMQKQYISKEASFFLLIYVFLTLFVGTNVRYFLHLNWEGEGILQLVHYISLPVLLLTAGISYSRLRFSNTIKIFFWFTIFIIILQRIVLNRTAGLSFLTNNVYEPILLLSILSSLGEKYIYKIRKIILLFLIIESLIALYEYITGSYVFANPEALSGFLLGKDDMRAAAIHGHPLQNAFVVSIIMVCILFSNLKIQYRYLLYLLGWIALACFNTRSSILLMGGVLVIGGLLDMKRNKVSIVKRVLSLIILALLGYAAFNFALSHGMGSRMEIGMNSDDGSSYARFVLVQAFQEMDLSSLLFGPPEMAGENIMVRYGLVAVENSFANIVLGYGLIFTIIFSIAWVKIFWKISAEKMMKIMLLFVIFILLNTNNAIMTDCPIISIAVMALYCMGRVEKQKVNIK